MVLIAILWKKYGNKILKILFYSYGCLALVYNVANLCIMSSSLKIIDFDLMLQIVDSLFIFFTSVGWIYCFVLGGVLVTVLVIGAKCRNIGSYSYLFFSFAICCFCTLFYIYGNGRFFYTNFFRSEWIIRPFAANIFYFAKDVEEFLSKKEYSEILLGKIDKEDIGVLEKKGLITEKKVIPKKVFDKIIVVAMESIDLYYMNYYNPDIPEVVTKNFNHLLDSYVSFSNFYTAAQPTNRGLHALLASRLDYEFDNAPVPNLFSEFNKNGYETYFLSAVSGYYGKGEQNIRLRYGPKNVFFSEYFERKYSLKSKGWGLDSEIIFDEAKNIISNNNKVFIFISTIDTHPPYGNLPKEGDLCFKDEKVKNSKFLLSLCHLDREIGDFIYKILPVLDERSLIILTSDHSATHGENYTKRKSLTPDRIPLIFITKNSSLCYIDNGSVADNYVSQIDFPSTLLNIVGLPIPKSFMGGDVFNKNVACVMYDRNTISLVNETGEIRYAVDDVSPVSKWYKSYYNHIYK